MDSIKLLLRFDHLRLLQIGTENEPHPTRAVITLYGHVFQTELPLFGTKVLMINNGSLELHGKKKLFQH